MFAPSHHGAMKHAAPVRKELGIRTIFNILGPLTNPAGAANQLLGVFHPDLVGIQVRVLQRLGSKHVLVVYGKDGMDEVSLGAATMVGELQRRRGSRVRDPSGGLRHADDEQPRAQGRRTRESRRRWCWRRSTTSKARRARSSMLNAGSRALRGQRRGVDQGRHRARARVGGQRRRAAQARRVRRVDAEARAAA